MNYFLNRAELKELIDNKSLGKKYKDRDFERLYADMLEWDIKFIVHNYLTALNIEVEKYEKAEQRRILNTIYNLAEEVNLEIEEIDADFIKYLFGASRQSGTTLLEEISNRLQTFNEIPVWQRLL